MTLAELQRQFHAAITRGAPFDGDARGLAIYTNAYYARIHDVLVADYPKLATVMGPDAFRALVVPYLRAFPTRHPSLREAGAHLAAFLDDPRLADLARLERARVEAFDGPDARPLAPADLAALAPDDFATLPVRLVPTAALVELATNADEIWDAIEDGRSIPASTSGSRTVLVWRRDVTVIHRTLDPDERCLASCVTFADVCDAVGDAERAIALLVRWVTGESLSAGDACG